MHKTRIGLAALLALGLWASSARAQSNEEKLQEKLSKEFATRTAWVMDLDEATKAAKESNKLIFAYFSRSYAPWGPCNAVEGGTLNTDEFVAFTAGVVPFLHVTTQIPGRKDDDLLQRKGGAGFPYFAALDAEGGLIAQNDGPRTVEGFQQMMRKGQEFLDLGAKAASGDEAATIEFALREAELGRIDYEAAQARLGARTLTAEQSARLANIRAVSVIHEQVNKINAAEGSEESFAAAADEFCKLLQSGAKPSPNTMDGNTFAQILARWAQTAEDPAKLDIVLAYFKDVLADNPRAQPFLDKLEGRVRDLKEGPSEEEPAEEEDGETDIEDSGD